MPDRPPGLLFPVHVFQVSGFRSQVSGLKFPLSLLSRFPGFLINPAVFPLFLVQKYLKKTFDPAPLLWQIDSAHGKTTTTLH